jgi:hypothetical protein
VEHFAGAMVNPCSMSFGALKKAASKAGVSPIGNQDEILTEFVSTLEKTSPASGTSSSSSSTSTAASSSGKAADPVRVAEKIIELDEVDDYEGILNIGGDVGNSINRNTPVSSIRKAYLKLSLLIHPDKIGRLYDRATQAFQALVRAFDNLSAPDMMAEGVFDEDNVAASSRSGGRHTAAPKQFTIARSNEGCYRTRICCPRCRQPWSEGSLDGNPNYAYNFIMQGLKCFTCSTCLCEFGCMTAIHKCPHCSKPFEYSPADYHRKISCTNSKCQKPFGFFMFPTSDRVLKDLRLELKQEQERKIKIREAKQRRNQSASRRSEKFGSLNKEKAFVLGLIDVCPRCGESLEEFESEDACREHLLLCNDSDKHASYSRKQKAEQQNEEARKQKVFKQEAAQNQAAFTFLGSHNSQLWLLDDDQVRHRAVDLGVDASGSKEEVIQRIAGGGRGSAHAGAGVGRGSYLITNGEDPSTSSKTGDSSRKRKEVGSGDEPGFAIVSKSKARRLHADDLPSNFHSLSAAQLRTVCASNGLLSMLPPKATKDEIISLIEDELYE